jgi:hypothetical protein
LCFLQQQMPFLFEKRKEREDLYYNAILFLFTRHLDTHTFSPLPFYETETKPSANIEQQHLWQFML